jgi:hypothetical protein
MPIVGRVTVPVVHIVGVALVRHGNMTALRSVLVGVALMLDVHALSAFVHMIAVLVVNVTVMHVVGVIAVRNRHVPAARTVRVVMTSVRLVLQGIRHGSLVLPRTELLSCLETGLPVRPPVHASGFADGSVPREMNKMRT